MPNSRAVSRRLRPSTNVEPSDKAPRFSCSRPTSSNRDIGLPLATFYAARSGTAPPLLWPTFSPAHTPILEIVHQMLLNRLKPHLEIKTEQMSISTLAIRLHLDTDLIWLMFWHFP